MLFKDLFDREFITEEKIKKTLKIFYKINLDLYKTGSSEPVNEPAPVQQEVPQQQPVEPIPAQNNPLPDAAPTPQQSEPSPTQNGGNTEMNPLPSVVTEDEVSVNDQDKVLRKFDGEVELSDNQKDTIQTFDDIVSILSEHKKDGENILDEFSTEIIQLLYSPNAQELNQKIDKKSSIFVEVYYGYKKDDSIGVRFNKRKNSDSITSTMLIDNEIISAPFSIDRVDQKISEMRNYEVGKKS